MPSVADRLSLQPSPSQNVSSLQALTADSAEFRRHFDQLRGTEHAKNDLF